MKVTFLLLATALNTILAQQNKAECLAMRYTDEQLEAVGDEGCAQAAAQLEAVWLPSCGDSPFLLVDTCDDYIDAMVQMCAVLCPVDKCEACGRNPDPPPAPAPPPPPPAPSSPPVPSGMTECTDDGATLKTYMSPKPDCSGDPSFEDSVKFDECRESGSGGSFKLASCGDGVAEFEVFTSNDCTGAVDYSSQQAAGVCCDTTAGFCEDGRSFQWGTGNPKANRVSKHGSNRGSAAQPTR